MLQHTFQKYPLFFEKLFKYNRISIGLKSVVSQRITDTFENVCYNIQYVKSNYLKCIATMFITALSVDRDLKQQDGWKTQDGGMTKKCRARPGTHSLT